MRHTRMTWRRGPLIVLAWATTACVGMQPQTSEAGSSNLTAGMVRVEVVEGETTQARILEVFGAPNIVTMNGDGESVWSYNRMAFESTSTSGGVLGIFWAGSVAGAGAAGRSVSSSTVRSFDLILVFDEQDVVRDFRVISSIF